MLLTNWWKGCSFDFGLHPYLSEKNLDGLCLVQHELSKYWNSLNLGCSLKVDQKIGVYRNFEFIVKTSSICHLKILNSKVYFIWRFHSEVLSYFLRKFRSLFSFANFTSVFLTLKFSASFVAPLFASKLITECLESIWPSLVAWVMTHFPRRLSRTETPFAE